MTRKTAARSVLLFAALALIVFGARVAQRRIAAHPRRGSSARSAHPAVTRGEREAAWAADAAHRLLARRTGELASEAGRLHEELAELEERATGFNEDLATARRLLAVDTALANENLRLRGAVEALTAAIALRSDALEADTPRDEVEALEAEILDLELQLKEMADERDRSAEEADRLRATLESISKDAGSGDNADAERRLRDEVDRLRRTLAIERERNLRLGRRSLGPLG